MTTTNGISAENLALKERINELVDLRGDMAADATRLDYAAHLAIRAMDDIRAQIVALDGATLQAMSAQGFNVHKLIEAQRYLMLAHSRHAGAPTACSCATGDDAPCELCKAEYRATLAAMNA